MQGPGDFAWRMGLNAQAQQECQLYGCAVVEFDLPDLNTIVMPPPFPGSRQGLTVGKAREWMTTANVPFDDTTMAVKYVDNGIGGGSRWFDLPL